MVVDGYRVQTDIGCVSLDAGTSTRVSKLPLGISVGIGCLDACSASDLSQAVGDPMSIGVTKELAVSSQCPL